MKKNSSDNLNFFIRYRAPRFFFPKLVLNSFGESNAYIVYTKLFYIFTYFTGTHGGTFVDRSTRTWGISCCEISILLAYVTEIMGRKRKNFDVQKDAGVRNKKEKKKRREGWCYRHTWKLLRFLRLRSKHQTIVIATLVYDLYRIHIYSSIP